MTVPLTHSTTAAAAKSRGGRPSIRRGIADGYASDGESIFELTAGRRGRHRGGLISVRTEGDGKVIVELYRLDDGVEVRVSKERLPTQ